MHIALNHIIITDSLIHTDAKGEYKNLWDTYAQHKRKMDLPSGSGASEEPNWIFWKDFSKYNSLPRNKEAVGSFTADLFNDSRILGREDNHSSVVSVDDEVGTVASGGDVGDPLMSVASGGDVGDPLKSKTWAPTPRTTKKRKADTPDVGLQDVMKELHNMIKEDIPTTSQEMMRRSIVTGLQAILMDVSDTAILRRLSSELLAFAADRIESMSKK